MAKHIFKIATPRGEGDRLLLHACCAPCCGAILEALLARGIKPAVFYSNSNIYPESEYLIRRDECRRYCEELGVDFIEDIYDHSSWRDFVKGFEQEGERGSRCGLCFRFRLGRAARFAKDMGYTLLSTSLASSRWKSLEQVDAAGSRAVASVNTVPGNESDSAKTSGEDDGCAEKVSVDKNNDNQLLWWEMNWRKGGLQERRGQIIKERDFYNQLYCGCEFSIRGDK